MSLSTQIVWLFVLAVPVACVAWTITHEEVFREARNHALRIAADSPQTWKRKFFYLFTCEYCFSHYISIFFVILAGYKLLLPDWRGFVVAIFAVVWVANQYMSIYGMPRLGIRRERAEIKGAEQHVQEKTPPVRIERPAA